jgi:rRNA maturation endonuclease Nob1
MLDEKEFKKIWDLYGDCMRDAKRDRRLNDESNDGITIEDIFKSVRDEYEKMTGFRDIHHNAIIHHEIKAFGEECPDCGKPFRTPRAQICAECGYKKEQTTEQGHSL